MSTLASLRVALVHDWLTGMRGGEKVLEVFARLFPAAPIYTLIHQPGSVSPTIESHPIRTSKLQRLPGGVRNYRYYLPLMPHLIEALTIEPVDLVLSTSSCVAKGIHPPPGALHMSYVHSPMRYIYDRYDDYFGPGRSNLATRFAIRSVRRYLQRWDIASTERVHFLAANSSFVQWRIWSLYGRASQIIYPPVDIAQFNVRPDAIGDYYLMVSALVPYKNVDVAIEAFRLLDRQLVIAGTGPLGQKLSASAPSNVRFLGWVPDADLPQLVAGCRAFLMPNVEDFGIAPVEAMAAGRPVIALGQGGACDSVRDLDRFLAGELPGPEGPTGIFYPHNDPRLLAEAIRRFEENEIYFEENACRSWAAHFSTSRFEKRVVDWLTTGLAPSIHRQAA